MCDVKYVNQECECLCFSGQVHIIASDRDESSEDEFNAPLSPPKIVLNPNTDVLDVSQQ